MPDLENPNYPGKPEDYEPTEEEDRLQAKLAEVNEQLAVSEAHKHPGTPQSAANESFEADGVRDDEVDLDAIAAANKRRYKRLPMDVPDDYGGGTMWVRAATAEHVQKAGEDYDRTLRTIPWVKTKFGRDAPLRGKPGTDSNRKRAVNCVMGWRPSKTLLFREREEGGGFKLGGDEKPIKIRKTPDQIEGMSLLELRQFIEMAFLPKMQMGSDRPSDVDTEDQINYEFFILVHNAVQQATDVPASEIHRLGEAFRLGPGGSEDLDE